MRINKIMIQNFKFFQDKEIINLAGKNLLIYGENGSGKSSLNWALYTVLQSSFKEKEEIKKYFDKESQENLLNKYLFNSEKIESNITLELDNNTKYSIGKNKFLEDRMIDVQKSFFASDFINYKILYKFHDFKNSEDIDLFNVFLEEVFPYISDTDYSNYQIWFNKNISEIPTGYTKSNEPNLESKNILQSINKKLQEFIEGINVNVNNILQNDFNEKNLRIILNFIEGKTYSEKVSGNTAYYGLEFPKIELKVELLTEQILEDEREINKPHTFLNEAKLTSIALAIRFSILEMRLSTEGILKLLVLDDLLLSLDMSKRMQVLELLENKYKEFQIIMLTHDRSFFEVVKTKLDDTEWEKKEFYVNDIGNKPFIKTSLNYLEKAEEHYNNHDYPASANYLRKEVEFNLNKYLKLENLDDFIILLGSKIFTQNLNLTTLEKDILKPVSNVLNSLKEFKDREPQVLGKPYGIIESFCTSFQSANDNYKNYIELIEKIKKTRTILFNPLSHSEVINIYSDEINEAIELIKQFKEKLNGK